MKVYSLYPFSNFISADGTALDAIHFVYGMRFNQYCIVSDTLCMNAVPNNTDSYDNLTIIHAYPDGMPSQSLSYNGDLLIFATISYATFTSPSVPDNNTLSILCLSCMFVDFQLAGVQNAVLSVASTYYRNSNVTGPSNYFELNVMHWAKYNRYFLQNTTTVVTHSLGDDTEVYLGNVLDVHVHCALKSIHWSCTGANIWSTLQRNEVHLATLTPGYWNLDTKYEFLIHFDFEPHACTYIDYTSNCSCMTINPTTVPTTPPTRPTNNPSYEPSHIPSQQTEYPSNIPTYNPSHHPSSQPTSVPTTPPTHLPSSQPTSVPTTPPTHLPSKVPTMTPTRDKLNEQEVNDPTETTAFVESESVIANPSSIDWILVVLAICVSVLIICTVTALKFKNSADKTIENLEPENSISNQDKNIEMNQIPNKEKSLDRVNRIDGFELMSSNTAKKMTREQGEVGGGVIDVVEGGDRDDAIEAMYRVPKETKQTPTDGTKGHTNDTNAVQTQSTLCVTAHKHPTPENDYDKSSAQIEGVDNVHMDNEMPPTVEGPDV
eukprot:898502_1